MSFACLAALPHSPANNFIRQYYRGVIPAFDSLQLTGVLESSFSYRAQTVLSLYSGWGIGARTFVTASLYLLAPAPF